MHTCMDRRDYHWYRYWIKECVHVWMEGAIIGIDNGSKNCIHAWIEGAIIGIDNGSKNEYMHGWKRLSLVKIMDLRMHTCMDGRSYHRYR